MFEYTFNKIINNFYFQQELSSALLAKLNHIIVNGNNSTIYFSSILTTPEEADLNNVVTAHPLTYKNIKIWDYITDVDNINLPPKEINFKTGLNIRLHPKRTFVFGELNKIVYHASSTVNPDGTVSYSTPVIEENFIYTRDPNTQFPISRTQEIKWYYDDETISPDTKIRQKTYEGIDALNELKRRRDNNVKLILFSIIGLVVATDPTKTSLDVISEGKVFFELHDTNRSLYINEGNQNLMTDVQNDTTLSWMDNDISALPINTNGMPTIRDHILYELTMGTHVPV